MEAVAREASPRTGQDVLAALLAGLVTQPRRENHAKRKIFFVLCPSGVYRRSKKKEMFSFGGGLNDVCWANGVNLKTALAIAERYTCEQIRGRTRR